MRNNTESISNYFTKGNDCDFNLCIYMTYIVRRMNTRFQLEIWRTIVIKRYARIKIKFSLKWIRPPLWSSGQRLQIQSSGFDFLALPHFLRNSRYGKGSNQNSEKPAKKPDRIYWCPLLLAGTTNQKKNFSQKSVPSFPPDSKRNWKVWYGTIITKALFAVY
jgi:hypothetical protein